MDVPDLNELESAGLNTKVNYCFPHFFLLPSYSSTSSYRIRPLGPEETLFGSVVPDPLPRGSGAAPAKPSRTDGA